MFFVSPAKAAGETKSPCTFRTSVCLSINILHRKHDNLKDIELAFTKLGTYIPLGKILDEFNNGDLDPLFKVTALIYFDLRHRKHNNLKDIELAFTKPGTYIPLGKILDEFDNGDLDLLFKVTTPYILRTWAP